jgi:hypothetical protein
VFCIQGSLVGLPEAKITGMTLKNVTVHLRSGGSSSSANTEHEDAEAWGAYIMYTM